MTKEIDTVKNYISSKKDVLNYFGCHDDIFIKYMENYFWNIKDNDSFFMLSYCNNKSSEKTDAIIVKKDGKPTIYKTEKYSMVVAIDCVKTGFIFLNSNKIHSL